MRSILNCRLRLMTLKDTARIFLWRNKEFVRENMLNDSKITILQHTKWIGKTLKRDDVIYFIFEYDGEPVGLINFTEIKNNTANWGFYLSRRNLPKGLGTTMCSMAKTWAHLNGITKIKAKVYQHNKASIRIHEKTKK